MYFTLEDYKKIENWLHRNSVKDTEFQEALPFTGKEIVAIVQDGYNRKMSIKDFVEQLFNVRTEDFLNITSSYNAPNITLEEAIRLVPDKAREEGKVITFLNNEGNWEMYQFRGNLNQWNTTSLWENPGTRIVQELGNNANVVMSQKAVNDNVLTSKKFLPFYGYEVGLNDAAPEAIAPSGYTINYHRDRNMFFAVVDNVNYSNWGNAEQLLYNRGYSAREDNVYFLSNGNICVIQNGSMTAISVVGGMLNIAFSSLESQITAETERAISEEEQIEANLDAEVSRARMAEGVLRDNLNAEVTRATAAEGALLSANKFLPFSAFNTDLDVTLQMASTMRSGEPILYINKYNVFAIEKNGYYYPSWGTSADLTESLKYNNGNGTVGYTAREDNVYIAENYDMYVIINGLTTLVTHIGTMLDIARSSWEYDIERIKADIGDLLSRVEALEA